MKTYKKDVSDEEVRRMMVDHINEMLNKVRPRVQVELKQEDKVEVKTKTKKKPAGWGRVSRDEREFLVDIFEYPDLSVTTRGSRLGLSDYKMNNLKAKVIDMALVEQFSVNIGKEFGGRITLLALTGAGYKALRKKPVVRPDNVSEEHWWWQTHIKDYFERKGVKAELEKSIDGKRADIGLVKDGEEVAVEVELSPKNALSNITVDLDAGFDRVVCCCKDKMVAKEVQRRLKEHKRYASIKDLVEVKVLTELQLVKEMCGK